MAAGSYNVIIKSAGGCNSPLKQVTINAQPSVPLAPTVTETAPTCALQTGTLTISGVLGETYSFDGASFSSTLVYSGLAQGSLHTIKAMNAGGCVSSDVNISITSLTNTWNTATGGWSLGIPTVDQTIVFDDTFSSTADLTACSCLVKAAKSVTINPLHTLTITNGVTVEPTGSLKFKSDLNVPLSSSGSLVQINDVSNSGDIIYERITNTTVLNTDYTYWSSPVAGFTLGGVSPNTLAGKFYSYDDIAQDWKQESSATTMADGRGYIIRGPENSSPPTPPSPYFATFTGVPNNGTVTLSSVTPDSLYLLGNPYPSAINADKFLNENSGVLDGTLYFWTHNTQIGMGVSNPGTGLYAYSSDDYASYNITGGVGTSGNTIAGATPSDPRIEVTANRPTGKIAAGQGFLPRV